MSPPDTGPYETVRLRGGVESMRHPRGTSLVDLPDQEPVTPEEEAVVRTLVDGSHRMTVRDDGTGALLDRLRSGGWLAVTVHDADGPVFTVEPHRSPAARPVPPPPGRPRLSRFTAVRASADGLLWVSSPRAWAAVVVHRPEAAVVLADPGGERRVPGLDEAVAARLRHDLLWAGLAVVGDEDEEFRVRQWSWADLEFHQSSRGYTPGFRLGRTGWGAEYAPAPPPRPEPSGPAVELRRPDLERLRGTDPPFTSVLESRRSLRRHDPRNPLTCDRLAEFLYRTARTVHRRPGDGMELQYRPYPSGGAAHELEVYVVAARVAGLEPGTYHYDGHDHRLELVRPMDGPGRLLVDGVGSATSQTGAPQALLLISARFERLMWAYEGLAYALILKHVGALMQTMNLVATAMGLAGCALGTSTRHAFGRLTGLDPLEEDLVGEFLLGVPAGPAQEEGGRR
ncbi:SagB family peptide dehydrogenase [Nocardiopsis sp. NPDC057823]|uniref:SagB family peptide dehydrogenase n=1 Tax=Nocardiopsis sp. NPDC057823 TaxID=3346256 RepID=UPI00366AD68C